MNVMFHIHRNTMHRDSQFVIRAPPTIVISYDVYTVYLV